MIKRCSKKGYEFSFAWIFAVFIGATVIFLAIYIATQIVGTERTGRDATEGKSLGILLTPIETQTEEGKFATIVLADETRLYHECEYPEPNINPFGSDKLQVSVKPVLGERWDETDAPQITFHNKYFFPSAEAEPDRPGVYFSQADEEYYVLSKPLYLPFKVADLLIIWSDQEEYCFLDAPNSPGGLRSRLEPLEMNNVHFQSPGGYTCDSSTQKTVCFSGPCNIVVNENGGYVQKEGKTLYYLESQKHDPYSMMYAAIFSSPEIYECQTARLMAHTSELTNIYYSKSLYISSQPRSSPCSQTSQSAMLNLNYTVSIAAEDITESESSASLSDVKTFMKTNQFKQLELSNGGTNCKLF